MTLSTCSLSLPRGAGLTLPAAVPILWPVAAVVLAFILWWPLGIAALVAWRVGDAVGLWPCRVGRRARRAALPMTLGGSGNSAFDAHRQATLDRLKEERRALDRQRAESVAFLDQLKQAWDREEWDRFLASRAAAQG